MEWLVGQASLLARTRWKNLVHLKVIIWILPLNPWSFRPRIWARLARLRIHWTFFNTVKTGAIKVSKFVSGTWNYLSGAVIQITQVGGIGSWNVTIGESGQACQAGLDAAQTYTVQEIAPPTGYNLDLSVYTVTITNDSTCDTTTISFEFYDALRTTTAAPTTTAAATTTAAPTTTACAPTTTAAPTTAAPTTTATPTTTAAPTTTEGWGW